jgi:glucose-6-phosphate 1-dehydrogenase
LTCSFENVRIPDAYETLLLDVLEGSQENFVRADELQAAWRIVTPLLEHAERTDTVPAGYPFGSRGPHEADEQLERVGYARARPGPIAYSWPRIDLASPTHD